MKYGNCFRTVLPLLQTGIAGLFGGWGLWQRNYILSHSFLGWNSTSRFHVWQWPFKFAAVLNMPAFLGGLFLSWPIERLCHTSSELLLNSPALFLVALLWYCLGRYLDGISNSNPGRASIRRTFLWGLVMCFMGISAVLAYLNTSYTSYLPYGVMLWIVVGARILGRKAYRMSTAV